MPIRLLRFIGIPLLVTVAVAITMNYAVTAYGIREAREHVRDILLANRGFHQYIQRVMHPAFFNAMQTGYIREDFYEPELLSSTYIVRTQHQFFNEIRTEQALKPVYYKLAANNPRNPVNKADAKEAELIRLFNSDRRLKESEEIVKVGGSKFIYYAVPFLENQGRCMRCHGDPADAPAGLRARYPEDGGFYEKLGEIRAVESIRMPVDEHFDTANIVTAAVSSGAFALLMLGVLSYSLRNRILEKTAHLEAEIEYRKRAEENYREVVEGTGDLITKVDARGTFTYVNPLGEKIFGLPQDELIGMSAFDFIHPDDRGPTRQQFDEFIVNDEASWSFENRQVNRKNGRVCHMLWASRKHFGPSGNVANITGIGRDITERFEFEKRLIESEAQKNLLLNSTAEGIYGLDTGGICTFVNTSCLRMLGYDSEGDLIGRSMHGIMHHSLADGSPYPEDRCRIYEAFGTKEGFHTDREVFWRKDGTSFPVEYWAHPIVKDGGVRGAVIAFVDITDKRFAEQALLDSEKRYKSLVENSPIPIFVHAGGMIVYTNNAAVRAFGGASPEDILGKSPMEFVHPEAREIVLARIRSIYKQEEDAPLIEERLVRLDGTGFMAEVCGTMIQYVGHPASQVMFVDITRRKQAEEALRESRETLALAQSVSGMGIWSWDIETGELEWSAETYDLFRLGRDVKPVFDGFSAMIHADDRDRVLEAIRRAVKEEAAYDIQFRVLRTDGLMRHVHAKGKVLFEDGRPVRMLGMIYDITEQTEARETIAASLREKEVLLKEVHHRVKNNMAVISSLLSLQSAYIDNREYVEIFKESQSRIRSMAMVHEKLYQQDRFSCIDVSDYLVSLAESVMITFSGRSGARLDTDIERIDIEIDTLIPLGLIVNELMTNSLKHAFAGHGSPVIYITLRQTGENNLMLKVADNGVGLPGGFALDICAGLGLKLVRTLVNQLNGDISHANSGGAVFTINCCMKIEYAGRGELG